MVSDKADARPRSIAVVSGKGGSGKTIVSATMARVLHSLGTPVVLIDADLGTGGMTYYLSVGEIEGNRVGLTDHIFSNRPLIDVIRPLKSYSSIKFLSLGDPFRLYKRKKKKENEHTPRDADTTTAAAGSIESGSENSSTREDHRSDAADAPSVGATVENANDLGRIKVSTDGIQEESHSDTSTATKPSIEDPKEENVVEPTSNASIKARESVQRNEDEKGSERGRVADPNAANGDEVAEEEISIDIRQLQSAGVLARLPHLRDELRDLCAWIIFDCRGGLDKDSISVCEMVDDIIIISEVDTTSYQATRHLIDVLVAYGLGSKIQGFIINKAVENVELSVQASVGFYGIPYLFSIPFDWTAARDFRHGEIPALDSHFGIHVWEALHRLYGDVVSPKGRVWKHHEFQEAGITDKESRAGGLVVALVVLGITIPLLLQSANLRSYFREADPNDRIIKFAILALTIAIPGLLGCWEKGRKFVGKLAVSFGRRVGVSLGYDSKS